MPEGEIVFPGNQAQKKAYTLGFPNDEVKYGFLESLMPAYTGNIGAGSGKDILSLTEYLENGKLDNIRDAKTKPENRPLVPQL